ncbi:MAG: hypothetical protein ACK4WK_03865 [Anaerolineae bacterium]
MEETLEEVSRQHVPIVGPAEVRDYLLRYPDIIELVPQVIRLARRDLPEAQLILTVYQDPEIDEEEYLVIYARFAHYDESVIEKIDTVMDKYLRQLVSREGWIQLTTDFRPPEDTYAV